MNLLIITQKVDQKDQLLGFFIGWIKEFASKFKSVTVLCLEKDDYNLPDNVRIISLGKDKNKSKLRQLFNFYRAITTLEYDVVFVHMNPIWMVLGGLYWRLSGKKACLWYTSKGVTFKLKIAEMLASGVFTASSESFRLHSKKVVVTGHGIDTELFKSDPTKKINDDKLRILSVGRIASVKNYGVLIDATKILKDAGVKFLVTIVGEPPLVKDIQYQSEIKNKISHLGLEDSFIFVGKVLNLNLPSYYQSNDIFIHMSKTGSLDKAILEAMACGMRVLSSNDAAREFLPAKLLFNENDARELADKIERMSKENADGQLRQYVTKMHNLDTLIRKITKLMINK